MPYILKNNNLEIHFDYPLENYCFSRFDYTGKITKIKYQNIDVTGVERTDLDNPQIIGQGLYNEFGIDEALGFNETKIGEWFHKIGVGLLKKDTNQYEFHKAYEINPCQFEIKTDTNNIKIVCVSEHKNGYAYILTKTISLFESSFKIEYELQNVGSKVIDTDEYSHNFISINRDLIGSENILNFPFDLKPNHFNETVNKEDKVIIDLNAFKFSNNLKEQFFFSNISGNKKVSAHWSLINLKHNIGISETGSFETNKINLWGWTHVISPELFYKVHVEPKKTITWSRNYQFFNAI